MISLDPPFETVGGITVLRDHVDPGQRYLVPSTPRLALGEDGTPALSLVEYLGGGSGEAAVAGGLLTLATELVVDDGQVQAVRQALLARGESPDLRLSPVGFDSGTVELVALGASSAPAVPGAGAGAGAPGAGAGAGAAASGAGAGPFEVRFAGSGRTSLGGTNRATFQLLLDPLAARLVERCLDEPDLPVLVTYSMSFAGLRRAFATSVRADWTRVYHHLSQRLKANVYVLAADAEVEVTRALEESGVEIDTTVFGVGEGAAAAASRAREKLVDWVLQRMCEPIVTPPGTGDQVAGAVDQVVSSLVRAVVPGVSYRLRSLDERQLRTFDLRASETVAEVQQVSPSGTLGATLRGLRVGPDGQPSPQWPALREAMVSQLSLDGFPRLDVSVGVEDRFASDGLRQVTVALVRPGGRDRADLSFRAAQVRQPYVVNLLGREERLDALAAPFEYQVQVDFDPTSTLGARPAAASAWRPGRTNELVVEPREAYAIGEVDVGASPTFSFPAYPAVTVELRPPDAPERVERVVVRPDGARHTWRFHAPEAAPGTSGIAPVYEYRATYHRMNADAHVGEWTASTARWLDVPDPMPEKLELTMFVDLPWEDVLVAFLQLRYQDPATGISYPVEKIPLTAATPLVERVLPIAAGGSRAVDHRLTVKFRTGPLLDGSWRTTTDDRIVIDRRLVDMASVGVRLIGGPLADRRLRDVRVELERRRATGEVVARLDHVIRAGQESEPIPTLEYLLGDPPDRTVHVRGTFVDVDGFTVQTPWTASTADLVIVNARTSSITA